MYAYKFIFYDESNFFIGRGQEAQGHLKDSFNQWAE